MQRLISILKDILYLDFIKFFLKKVHVILEGDERIIRRKYKKIFGKDLDLENPRTFSEKIQYKLLKTKDKRYTEFADKVLVRRYVANKVGSEYLVELFGVYHSVNEIDYNQLPTRFVLKCNHDSGSAIVCQDKSLFNKKKANKKLRFFLKRNYYYYTREYQYRDIKPLIICEEFIASVDKKKEVSPYRFHVLRKEEGVTIFIQYSFKDTNGKDVRRFFDEQWNLLDFRVGLHTGPEFEVPKPTQLDIMLSLARKLSEEFDYVRVDLFESDGKVYFNELTFSPWRGLFKFYPECWGLKWGDLWELRKQEAC